MPSLVLDASAILAALQEEPGGEAVFDLLVPPFRESVSVSAVNLCEVTSKLVRDGGGPRNVSAAISPFRDLVVPFDLLQAEKAAWLG